MIDLTGARIAAIAPSGAYQPALLEAGLDIARSAGFDVELFANTLAPRRYLASADEQRHTHLVEALSNPKWDAVWVIRGGYGITRLLPGLPWARFHPKPVIGFSDVTALFAGLWKHSRGALVHGAMLHSLQNTDIPSREATFQLLTGQPTPAWSGAPLVPGRAEGRLVGGNLAMLAALCGTPWQLDARGCVLALEDIGEAPYRIDRLLTQLRQSGTLDGVVGVALGEFQGCQPPANADWSLVDVLREALADIPTIADLPFGHGARNQPFVWGEKVAIDLDRLIRVSE
jgi:muramoyltetrapeptide carboxypeptidase